MLLLNIKNKLLEIINLIKEMLYCYKKISYKGEIATEILYRAVKEENENESETAMKFSSFSAKIPISGEIPTEIREEHPVIKAAAQIGNLEFRPQQNAFGENRTAELDFDYSVYLEIFCNEETAELSLHYSTEPFNPLEQLPPLPLDECSYSSTPSEGSTLNIRKSLA